MAGPYRLQVSPAGGIVRVLLACTGVVSLLIGVWGFLYLRGHEFVMVIPDPARPGRQDPYWVGSTFPMYLWIPSLVSQATIVLWLIWQHQATANLWARGFQGLRIRPGWAVGWWFIPFANLAMPLVAMLELDRRSTPDGQPRKASPLLGWWWAAWLASSTLPAIGMVGSMFSAMLDLVRSVDNNTRSVDFTAVAHAIAPWLVLSGVLQATAAALAFLVVRRIDRSQEQVVAAGSAAPARPDAGLAE